jgi:hypothetical protein
MRLPEGRPFLPVFGRLNIYGKAFWRERRLSMTETVNAPAGAGSVVKSPETPAVESRVERLETRLHSLEHETKTIRQLLERMVEHRQKSHSELVLLLAGLVSKLPINEIGVIVSKLVEHNENVSQYHGALLKGAVDAALPPPTILQSLDQTKKELSAGINSVLEELLQLDPPFEHDMLKALANKSDLFFSPQMVRANRCFIKGQVPRERILRQFGQEALLLFNDLTTDPKLNPRPKADEIVLGFKSDFEPLLEAQGGPLGNKKKDLLALYQSVQRSRASTEQARSQRNAFQRLSFLIELLHYYEHQNTEAPDVLFAQRLPALVEQLVILSPDAALEEKLILPVEKLMVNVVNPDHRMMIINNIGKSGESAKTLKYVLKLRTDKLAELDQTIADFVKHLLPASQKVSPEKLGPILKLINPDLQRMVVRSIMRTDRIRRPEAEALGKNLAAALGLQGLAEAPKAQNLPVEVERQIAWDRIKDLIRNRTDPTAVAAAIRERLNAKYDADEIRQSWITLTDADPIALIKIFSHLPYLANGKTDSIARTVMETYVTRLTHEKYASTYHKVVNTLKTMHHARPDSPVLVNFIALVRWASPEAADKLCSDVGVSK